MSRAILIVSGCLLALASQTAHAQAPTCLPTPAAATVRMPTIPDVDSVTANPWLQIGLNALSSVSANYSVSVPVNNTDTLAASTNQVHQGMTMAGWQFVSEEAVQEQGTTVLILLAYRRQERK